MPPNLPPRLGKLAPTLLVAWAAAVLCLFLSQSALSITGSALGSAATLGLGLGSVYLFWFTGHRLWRRLCARPPGGLDPLELSVLELGLGTSIAIGCLILAGALGLFRPETAWALLFLAACGGHCRFVLDLRARLGGPADRHRGAAILFLLVSAVALMTLASSLTPVISQDALVYHLAVPARYVEEGGFTYLPGNFFAQFPQNIEMLFTLGLLLRGEELAQWYHWFLAAAATAAVAALARRLSALAGGGRRGAGLFAAAIFATMPTVYLLAGWAYVDLGVVFFVLLSVLCFLRWWGSEARFWAVLAAVFAGVAAGSKYTAGLQGLLLCGAVFLAGGLRRWPLRRAAWEAFLVAAIVGVVASPWWVKNALYTGNPLHPFCYGLFGGADWDAERAEVLSLALAGWGGEKGLLETLMVPWRLTMEGKFFSEEHFDGVIGCVFLIAAPVLVAALRLSREHRVVLALTLIHAGFWLVMTRQVRFLLPALALAAALAGSTLPALPGPGWVRRATLAAVHCAMALNVLIASMHFAAHNPLPVVLGLEPRSQFLRREVPGRDYQVFEFIEKELPEESCILLGSLGNPGFLVKRRYHSDAFFENRTLAHLLAGALDAEAALSAFRQRGFTHLLFRWDCVFDPQGRKSEIPLADQLKLMDFLNRHARLLFECGGTHLYEIR